ncbi:MAG: ABC transporter substrate-binding protein [Pseudomonadota bacterium]
MHRRLDRRELLRTLALLGVSAAALPGMTGSLSAQEDGLPFPADDPKAKEGGVLRIVMPVREISDPATIDTVEAANQVRHTLEHLALIGPDNRVRPMLAQNWRASDDLTTWEIELRKRVRWHNGDELTADHVAWNVLRWLDPDQAAGGAAGLATFSAMLRDGDAGPRPIPGSVEVVDRYTIRLRLKRPVLSVMEDFYHPSTAICHPSFRPPFAADPVGTGPFTIARNRPGDACILKRVRDLPNGQQFAYWGGPVYLDEIHYYDSGADDPIELYAAGDVDLVYAVAHTQLEAVRELDAQIHSSRTARTLACRMRVDQAPFDDVRVREAIVRSVDNTALKSRLLPQGGDVGENHLVAPIHPAFSALGPPRRNIDRAIELLLEAGYPDGIDLTVDISSAAEGWERKVCEDMRTQMLETGLRLTINTVPADAFESVKKSSAFAAEAWSHHPLGTTVLGLAFRSNAPMNHARYANPEFDEAVSEAQSSLRLRDRRRAMERAAKELQRDYVMIQPLYWPVYMAASGRIQSVSAHPTGAHQFHKTWLG